MAYTSRYQDGSHIPDYDDVVSKLIAPSLEPGFIGRLTVAIENRDGVVYRVIAVEGMNAYVTLCRNLEAQGFLDRYPESLGNRYSAQYFRD